MQQLWSRYGAVVVSPGLYKLPRAEGRKGRKEKRACWFCNFGRENPKKLNFSSSLLKPAAGSWPKKASVPRGPWLVFSEESQGPPSLFFPKRQLPSLLAGHKQPWPSPRGHFAFLCFWNKSKKSENQSFPPSITVFPTSRFQPPFPWQRNQRHSLSLPLLAAQSPTAGFYFWLPEPLPGFPHLTLTLTANRGPVPSIKTSRRAPLLH